MNRNQAIFAVALPAIVLAGCVLAFFNGYGIVQALKELPVEVKERWKYLGMSK